MSGQGEIELDNLQVAQFVAQELGKELKYQLHDNPIQRPGHDLRYALDGDKLRALGFALPLTFYDSLRKTIHWMVANPEWLDVRSYEHDFAEIPPPILAHGHAKLQPGVGVRAVVTGGAGGSSGVDRAGPVAAAAAGDAMRQPRSKL